MLKKIQKKMINKRHQSDTSTYDSKWNKNKQQQSQNLLAFKNVKKTELTINTRKYNRQ